MIHPNIHEPTVNPGNYESSKYLELLIAFQKQTQSCTLTSIFRFVSNQNLSSRFRAFTANLDRIKISKNIHEALGISELRETYEKNQST